MRRALCVGIDQYEFGALTGCVSDAQRMAKVWLALSDGSPIFEVGTVRPLGGYNAVTRRFCASKSICSLEIPQKLAFVHF